MKEYVKNYRCRDCIHYNKEYVKIYSCGDCAYYNWEKHKCNLGATQEGKPEDHFYRDCPMGICEEKDSNEVTR